jgi:hypothetical protein
MAAGCHDSNDDDGSRRDRKSTESNHGPPPLWQPISGGAAAAAGDEYQGFNRQGADIGWQGELIDSTEGRQTQRQAA